MWRRSDGFYKDSRLDSAGIRHGVTSRVLGNMKHPENQEKALKAAGLEPGKVRFLKQVHGNRVLSPSPSETSPRTTVPRSGAPSVPLPDGDAWILKAGEAAAIFVADCLPLYLWSKDREVVGLAHVGWRGARLKLPHVLVREFRTGFSREPSRLCATVGPHIGPCCYRVGRELEGDFRPECFARRGEDIYLDLGAEVKAQLVEAGLPADAVSVSGECTRCNPAWLYSYRFSRADERMMAFAAI